MAALSLTELSPVHPFTTITPVVLVIGFSIVKEGIEDFRRYVADKEMNHRTVLRWDGGSWAPIFWKEVKPGDVLKVLRGETFPSDLVCLTSTLDDGVCYVETVQLDGETNTKVKRAMARTMEMTDGDLKTWNPAIECELPNKSIYTFTGNLITGSASASDGKQKRGSQYGEDVIDVTIEDPEADDGKVTTEGDKGKGSNDEDEDDDGKIAILPQSILLRGASLRNTDHVVGVAIFTGHSTKIMMNASRSPSKRSTIEKKLDKVILFMFCLLFTMCTVGAVFTSQWTKTLGPDQWYLDPANAPNYFNPKDFQTVGVTSFFTSFILYGYLIPISLYIRYVTSRFVAPHHPHHHLFHQQLLRSRRAYLA